MGKPDDAEGWLLHTMTIEGSRPLSGEIAISGAKNAVLPLLAAAACKPGVFRLERCPALTDVDATADILEHLGCTVSRAPGVIEVDSRGLCCSRVPRPMMLRLRSSVIFLGALLARCGEARLWLPGGCCIGARPIDLHLRALQSMGVTVEQSGEELRCFCDRLRGGDITLPYPSVGATENMLLAAMGAEGSVTIRDAAREPEVAALARFLCAMGAEVTGEGSAVLRVTAPGTPQNAVFTVPPDRIETATYLCALASAGGDLTLTHTVPAQLAPVIACLRNAGMEIECGCDTIRASCRKLRAIGCVRTGPYPAFPTDAQAPLMAALLRARGTTRLRETVFEHRFRHVEALRAMGADIAIRGRTARFRGVHALHGADVAAPDLRGGAAMVIAALGAEGVSHIRETQHIARGYERLCEKLRGLGAEISAGPE